MGGIYTVIRSKVPITKKEYGNNYICLGPYNDSFVKTEVEVGESKIDAIRETVNEMRRYGVHVSFDRSEEAEVVMMAVIGCHRQLAN